MRAQVRIVAGALRGRKLTFVVQPNLRPTPDMVRQALFSILGDAVPDRPFFDVFAGTGVVGFEAISRGASATVFVERDFRLIDELDRHIAEFGVGDQARVARTDVYRWVQRWEPPAEPVNVFLSPPFADYERRPDEFLGAVGEILGKTAPGSVVVVQGETGAPLDDLPDRSEWDVRRYGRNELFIRVVEPRQAPVAGKDGRNGDESAE
jgi:16S rRNA (guanine966-N2)-methyltransferase